MKKIKLLGALTVAVAMLNPPVVSGQDMNQFELPNVRINLLGLGIAGTPDYYGSTKNDGAIVPLARYTFAGDRYVQLLGPELSLNLIDNKVWRAGPVLRVRARRDEDVDDEIVKQMRPIASAAEFGAFAAYHLYLDNEPLHKVVFSGDIVGNTTDVYDGATGNLRVTYFHPMTGSWITRPTVGSIGLGMFFASDNFNRTYFGVTGSDVALFPSRGGVEYIPDGGMTSLKIPFSITTHLQDRWLLTVGGRYERLLGDAKDSPVVEERGDPNQWSLGFAVSRTF